MKVVLVFSALVIYACLFQTATSAVLRDVALNMTELSSIDIVKPEDSQTKQDMEKDELVKDPLEGVVREVVVEVLEAVLVDKTESPSAMLRGEENLGAMLRSEASPGAMLRSEAGPGAMLRSEETVGAGLRSEASPGAMLRSEETVGAMLRTEASPSAMLRSESLNKTETGKIPVVVSKPEDGKLSQEDLEDVILETIKDVIGEAIEEAIEEFDVENSDSDSEDNESPTKETEIMNLDMKVIPKDEKMKQ